MSHPSARSGQVYVAYAIKFGRVIDGSDFSKFHRIGSSELASCNWSRFWVSPPEQQDQQAKRNPVPAESGEGMGLDKAQQPLDGDKRDHGRDDGTER